MAKKRKLRSSESESEPTTSTTTLTPPKSEPETEPQSEPQPEPQFEPQPPEIVQEIPVKLEPEQENNDMEQDEAEAEDDVEEDDGEEEDDGGEVNGDAASDGGDDEDEDDDSDEEPIEKVLEPFSKEQLAALVTEAVSKYPEFARSVKKLADADPAHRKIFVHGLGWDTTAEILISEFEKFGPVEDCKNVTDKLSGKSKGYAFLLFKHRSGARKALKEPQKKIGTRMTSCQLASAGPIPAPPPMMAPVSEITLRKIFVSNVATEIDPEKLLEYFKQFGEIEDGPLGLDKQTGKPKGFALFVYKTVESAKKALEEPHKTFEGHTLHCQKAIDGPKQNKPFHQQQQQHYQPQYSQRKEKSKYMGGGSGGGHGHMMAPSGPGMGFNPAVSAQALNPALGQALSALLATQGGGMQLNNLLGGYGGAPMNQGMPVMNNAMYGNQAGAGYDYQAAMQGGYQNPQIVQSGAVRPQPGAGNMGGPPYMGH